MHLLIDARLFSSTFGIGRYTFELVQQFITLRPNWTFTLLISDAEKAKHSFPKNVTCISANEPIYSIAEQTSFWKKIQSIKADLTWFPHFSLPILYTKPFVASVHDMTLSKFPGKKKASLLHRIAYQITIKNALFRSKHIFTVSENTKKDIVEMEHIKPEKITVAHNAVGEEFFNYTSPEEDILSALGVKKPFFFYAGNWREHKNVLGLIQGFHQFLQATESDMQLVVSGKPDPLYPEFLKYRAEHNLENQVLIPGLVPENQLMELYKKAKAFVFPSFYEGFGLPPLEAMAMGTPVIASNSSCIPEVCGDAALYFDPYNPSAIAQQMQKIQEDELLRKELSEKGILQAKKYSWETAAKTLLETMERVESSL